MIVNVIFGDDELTDANSTILFKHPVHEIDGLLTKNANEFKKYIKSRLIPLIRNHVNLPARYKSWREIGTTTTPNLLITP